MLVDVQGKDIVPSDADPSATRGVNWLIEACRVGPEETGLHFVGLPYKERKTLLADIHEMMGFVREMWNCYNQIHLGMPDIPKRED